MRHTDLYRHQHAVIAELVRKLEQNLTTAKLQENTSEVWRTLAELSGQIIVHLSGEDRWLYPELRGCGDAHAAAMATKFAEEMGHINEGFKAYATRWLMPNAILDAPEAFIAETRDVARTLHDRMRREHTELYELADRLHSTAA
jgi:hypothetical protein